MTEASDYFLTEDQLRARFEERVKEFVFSGYEPQDQPVFVLLGGQPAAGKSQAMAATQQRHQGGNLVPLTGDELRPLHPRYAELLGVDAQTRETATAQASGAWVRMSIEHALTEKYSLILEGVFRDPDMTLRTAETFARAGNRVELVALSVREERSRLDALDRFLDGGRWTPPALQDLAYAKVPETVARAVESTSVNSIVVTNRTGVDLARDDRNDRGEWVRPPEAVQALQAERARPFPPEEAAQWLPMYRKVVVEMAARGEVNEASRPVLQRLAHDADAVASMADPDVFSPVRNAHEASKRILKTLTTEPVNGAALPAPLRAETQLTYGREDMAERRLRSDQSPAFRGQEDELRSQFAVARRRHAQNPSASTPSAGQQVSAPAPRQLINPAAGAARLRSTTVDQQPASPSSTAAPAGRTHRDPPSPNPGRSR
ncbi:zeta toxin family protein [Streptomyces sp. NPDC012746]|uniref:zeta toxin family protein n=1 Tax=Streptomyces sp. NPDC012746 TaxID=3364845 RepID=UPI00367D063E